MQNEPEIDEEYNKYIDWLASASGEQELPEDFDLKTSESK